MITNKATVAEIEAERALVSASAELVGRIAGVGWCGKSCELAFSLL